MLKPAKTISVIIAASVHILSIQGLLQASEPPAGASASVQAQATQSGSKPYITILCKFADTGKAPYRKSHFIDLMGPNYPGMDHFWREVSYNNIDLTGSDVVGWYTLPYTYAEYDSPEPPLAGQIGSDCMAEADSQVYFPQYFGINLIYPDVGRFGSSGATATLTLDGITKEYAKTSIWYGGNQRTVAHEMGHSLGLPHSYGGDPLNPYVSNWDVMSIGGVLTFTDPDFGQLGDHTIARHKDFLGWIPANQKYIAAPDSVEAITLERLAQPTDGGTAYLIAEIPVEPAPYYTPIDETHYYTLEARRYAGYDNGIPAEGVVIHVVDSTAQGYNPQARVIDADNDQDFNDEGAIWVVGESYVDILNNISVSIDADTGTGYAVTISTVRLGPMIETEKSHPSFLTEHEARFIGNYHPKGEETVVWFEWGLTSEYGNVTPVQAVGSGLDQDTFFEDISGLTRNTTYHFRAVGQNASGITYGEDLTFKTLGSDVDLIMIDAQGPGEASLGSSFIVSALVRNYGTESAGPFGIRVYLADDPQLNGAFSRVIGYGGSSGLGPGEAVSDDINVTIPTDVPAGSYYHVALADATNLILETDEENNFKSGTILITQADLYMSSVSGPSSGIIGTEIDVSGIVCNQGQGSSIVMNLNYYLSSDTIITGSGDDVLLGSQSMPEIGPGLCTGGWSMTVTIPVVPAGTYYIGAIADGEDVVAEVDEGNNALLGNAIDVLDPLPMSVTTIESGRYEISGKGKDSTVVFVLTTSFAAGDRVVFRVTVSDEVGQPIPNATVELTVSGPESTVVTTAPSNSNGVAEGSWYTQAPDKKGAGGTTTGSYTAVVTDVTADGYAWDGIVPPVANLTIN